MATTKTDRTTSADLAARLRERAAEYEEAGREKLRAESALLAAMANYERARYRERAAREEWDARLRAAGLQEPQAIAVSGSPVMHLFDWTRPFAGAVLCGVKVSSATLTTGSIAADCPRCLAALDTEVAP
jgi:hypothetical protein